MKQKFNPPQHYWKIAKEYIIKKDEELRKNGKYYIDKQLAMKCIKFGSLIKHTSGELAGVNFQFMEFQIMAIVDILGTKHLTGKFEGLRRYQRVLIYTPKKSGKTEFGSLLNLLIFFVDKEKSKEIYSIASEIEQAKILHKAFVTMLKQEPELLEHVHITKQPPKVTKEDGAFTDEYEALSSTADSKDGKRPSTVFIDEGHSLVSKDLYQIMVDGMSGRREPLEIHMSTAGYNMQGFFYRDVYTYAKKVRDGVLEDETFYQIMFEPTEEDLENDDWKNPELWKRVNPNMGVSPTYSYMEGKVAQAEQSEQTLIAFKTKHLNWWCDKAETWINHSIWTANQTPINEELLKGKKCYAGLDLASTTDIAALILLFPKENGAYDIVSRFFIPKDQMRERVRRDKVPYLDWLRDDLIIATDGNIIDYGFIEKEIKILAEKFDIQMLAYDRWNSSSLVTNLTNEEVVELIPFGQGFASMTAPTKQIEVLAIQENLNHGNNDVLNWMCSNIVLKRDPSDNIKIDKEKSTEKVDGMVALAMALGICILDTEVEEVNVYEERGIRSLA